MIHLNRSIQIYSKWLTSLPGWKGISGPPVTSTATTPASWISISHQRTPRVRTQTLELSISHQRDLFWNYILYLMEISKRDRRELLSDGLQQPKSNVDTTVGSMSLLILKPHRTEWTSGPRGAIECSSRVPSAISQTDQPTMRIAKPLDTSETAQGLG